ncbi:MAG: restriction endonuclease [Lamprocystis purpurea]|jgi:restriction endonuclease Mrr|uniref:restriction endonuclease n=1 Tax=Lamprocystis purpurea TaxID=61598 RepID=UPI0009FD43FC|nr:restriction endonuclease [Lamprocystis purpurea]MBV5272199.1 restriction endonuclease [Lamprocystis purpurea]
MGFPSSQTVASWVVSSLQSEEWILLQVASIACVKEKLINSIPSEIEERIEDYLPHIAEELRNRASRLREDGELETFEIDQEPSPYIRGRNILHQPTLALIREMDPSDFEKICAQILKKLGANSEATGKVADDGVDFIGYNFSPLDRRGLPTSVVSQAIVVGQAKRYRQSNIVTENDLRKFVGGALKKVHALRDRQDFGVLSPVVYSYWTTSDFDPSAKEYARVMGLWLMNGPTLAKYLLELEVELGSAS